MCPAEWRVVIECCFPQLPQTLIQGRSTSPTASVAWSTFSDADHLFVSPSIGMMKQNRSAFAMLPDKSIRALLLDLDGTVYDPDGLIPGVTEFIKWTQNYQIPY